MIPWEDFTDDGGDDDGDGGDDDDDGSGVDDGVMDGRTYILSLSVWVECIVLTIVLLNLRSKTADHVYMLFHPISTTFSKSPILHHFVFCPVSLS